MINEENISYLLGSDDAKKDAKKIYNKFAEEYKICTNTENCQLFIRNRTDGIGIEITTKGKIEQIEALKPRSELETKLKEIYFSNAVFSVFETKDGKYLSIVRPLEKD